MSKKLIEFLFYAVLFLAPFTAASKQNEMKFSADMITADRDGLLKAKGNVIVASSNIRIRAGALSFNQQTGSIYLTNITEFYDGEDIKFSANEAKLDAELSQGIIYAAKLLLDESLKIKADEVRLADSEISSAIGISSVTSCDECEGKQSKWYLTASSASRDVENLNIVYKNVTLRVKGLPIAYIPYIRMPDPSVERALGFLVPEAALTSNLATGLKLPYFVPIGQSRDILLTPYFSSKTKTIEYRYRQKFRSGNLTVNGAFSDDDLVVNDLRYFSQVVGNFELGYGLDLNFNVGKVSDASYLGDYIYSEESDLDSEVSIGKTDVQKQQFFEGDLSYLREKDKGNSLSEYYSLFGSYVRDTYSLNLPGRIRLSANLNSSVNVNNDNTVSRPPSSAQVGLDYNQFNFFGSTQLSTHLFGKFNSFVNSADVGTTSEEFSLKYGAMTSISKPYYMKGVGKTRFFKPRLSLSWTGQQNDILGDYFIGVDELSWGNVYSGQKIMSLTESEKGLSISLGFESQVFWETGRNLEISLAASKIDGLTYKSTSKKGLTSQKLNYLSKLSYQNRLGNSVSAQTLFSSEGQLLRGDFKGKYSNKKIDLGVDYEILDQIMDRRLSANLQTINLSSSYSFLENFLFRAGGRYDLTNTQIAKRSIGFNLSLGPWVYKLNQEYLKEDREKLSISAIYDDECTRLMFSFENRHQDLGSSARVKSLTFRVQLKPFAKVVFSQGTGQGNF